MRIIFTPLKKLLNLSRSNGLFAQHTGIRTYTTLPATQYINDPESAGSFSFVYGNKKKEEKLVAIMGGQWDYQLSPKNKKGTSIKDKEDWSIFTCLPSCPVYDFRNRVGKTDSTHVTHNS